MSTTDRLRAIDLRLDVAEHGCPKTVNGNGGRFRCGRELVFGRCPLHGQILPASASSKDNA